ncbi:hypothetical protein M918_07700 [Clostridium sp. BL8]|uniref:hypothetical protein n=1 Tax=Clostridium sp. BL8 TaxID=1354301 RepID=UPI00038A0AEC|nr:hypothetical protein [Clostridium sp. BL8]EQB87727.1 hypothetical protein M918_07700 [Clostridium sp. BL8]
MKVNIFTEFYPFICFCGTYGGDFLLRDLGKFGRLTKEKRKFPYLYRRVKEMVAALNFYCKAEIKILKLRSTPPFSTYIS